MCRIDNMEKVEIKQIADYLNDLEDRLDLWDYQGLLAGYDRSPRTCNERELKEKILLAVKQNHQDFDETNAVELIEKYVARAMIILDALWAVKTIGFPNRHVQKWKPNLK